jgi:hypothetical protein
VKNGVPFDVAFAYVSGDPLLQAEGTAMAVVFGEMEGGRFDWKNMRWEKQDV